MLTWEFVFYLIKETYKGSGDWYDDSTCLVMTNYPWYTRGAYAWDSYSGLFFSDCICGDEFENSYVSIQVVITP